MPQSRPEDYKQTAAALGILANNGVKGAEAGTALNSMLVRMTTKDVAQKAFKELGVSIYDSSGQMRNMQDILVELNGAMSGLTQEQKNNYMSAIAGTKLLYTVWIFAGRRKRRGRRRGFDVDVINRSLRQFRRRAYEYGEPDERYTSGGYGDI